MWVRTLRNGTAVRPRRHAGPHPAAPHARSVPTDTGAPADAGTFYARTDTAAAYAAADSDAGRAACTRRQCRGGKAA